MTRRRRSVVPACAAAASLLLGACGGASHTTTLPTARPQASASAASLQEGFVTVINRVEPEVVQISTPAGLGSGVVFNGHGDIVTNAHVVAGGAPLTVTNSRGKSFPAKLVGSFAPDDLAIVHVNGTTPPAASFANTSKTKVGDIVLAIGNPLGLRSSVTQGIVSALGRTVPEENGVVLPNVIQTSASINPGNSGGALVDLEAQVVGIPTLAATDPQLGGAAAGIGFAIPSSLITRIGSQLVEHGKVVSSGRAFLGVRLAAVSEGAAVAGVEPGGPAARAGVHVGEQIVSIAGNPINEPAQVPDVLATMKPGQRITLELVSPSGSKRTVTVTLGQYPGG